MHTTNTMMLKAVLFDLDDTLLDWSGFKSDWSTMEMQHLGGVYDYINAEVHPLDNFEAFMHEFRVLTSQAWQAARTSLRAPNLGLVLVEAANALGVPRERLDPRRCLEAYNWGAVAGTAMFPEVPEVLRLLHETGIKIGIVTNAYQPMWIRDVEIKQHGLLDYFPACRISAADVGYLKPHPSIFQTALDCLGTRPHETVFVGDDPEADIAGAQAAGLQAVLRISRRQPSGYSDRIVPGARINSLIELPPILDSWYPGWRIQSRA